MDNAQKQGQSAGTEQKPKEVSPEVSKDHGKHTEKTEGCEFC